MTLFQMPQQPPRWQFWLARLFGQRTETRDNGTAIIGYWWRGSFYVTKESRAPGQALPNSHKGLK